MKLKMTADRIDKHEMEATYNEVAQSFKNKGELLSTMIYIGGPEIDGFAKSIPDRKNAKVWDQGCGVGRIIKRLIANGIRPENITGVEMSPDQVVIAKGEVPEATIILGDLGTVNLKPNSFDAATQHMVGEHLDDETLKSVNEKTFETLKPGGLYKVVMTHPSKTAKSSGLRKSGSFITTFPWGGQGPNYHRTKEDLIKSYEDAGFVVDEVKDLKLPDEAQETHPEDYKRYQQYEHLRISLTMHKPE